MYCAPYIDWKLSGAHRTHTSSVVCVCRVSHDMLITLMLMCKPPNSAGQCACASCSRARARNQNNLYVFCLFDVCVSVRVYLTFFFEIITSPSTFRVSTYIARSKRQIRKENTQKRSSDQKYVDQIYDHRHRRRLLALFKSAARGSVITIRARARALADTREIINYTRAYACKHTYAHVNTNKFTK